MKPIALPGRDYCNFQLCFLVLEANNFAFHLHAEVGKDNDKTPEFAVKQSLWLGKKYTHINVSIYVYPHARVCVLPPHTHTPDRRSELCWLYWLMLNIEDRQRTNPNKKKVCQLFFFLHIRLFYCDITHNGLFENGRMLILEKLCPLAHL